MNHSTGCGYLGLIIGPMFSGKTSKLISLYEQYALAETPILAINHNCDVRYDKNFLCNHDKKKVPCIEVEYLNDIYQNKVNLDDYDIILINEGQFFQDLMKVVTDLVECRKKTVYVCGLDGDFQRNKFGSLLDLIPLCDSVEKLTSICCQCKGRRPAIFTKRTEKDNHEQVLVGAGESYMPVCRSCYSN